MKDKVVNQLALPAELSVNLVKDHTIAFVLDQNQYIDLFTDLKKCQTDEERKSIFRIVLTALDSAKNNQLLTDTTFSYRINALIRLDDSPHETGTERGYQLIKQVIVDLAGSPDDPNSKEEISIYDEDDDLEAAKKERTPYGLAVRLCNHISATLMQEKLDRIDVELGLCGPERMARYIRDAANYVITTYNRLSKSERSKMSFKNSLILMDDLISEAFDRDEYEFDFVNQVLDELVRLGYIGDREEGSNSYVLRAIRIMAEENFESAKMLLAKKWLDEDETIT